jgi:hypothetical protein
VIERLCVSSTTKRGFRSTLERRPALFLCVHDEVGQLALHRRVFGAWPLLRGAVSPKVFEPFLLHTIRLGE